MAYKYIYLTSGTQWVVPPDWNNSDNTIECYGGGASGAGSNYGPGGGGGAWALRRNLSLTIGATITYQIGAGGSSPVWNSYGNPGGSTWFNGSTFGNSSCGAPGGGVGAYSGTGNIFNGGTGGQSSACRGGNGTTVVNPGAGFAYSGGNGGSSNFDVSYSGGGGGGAAGPGGAGLNGSPTQPNNIGGNGGGGGGYPTSGAGAGGAGGTNSATPGQPGGNGGAGGGGGGGGVTTNFTLGYSGGSGGFWGGAGGGGGYGFSNFTSSLGGAGIQGIIVIGYEAVTFALPSSGPISLNDINQTWFQSGIPITLGDPEVRYLLESGTYNQNFMPLPALLDIDLAAGYSKPTFTSTTASYTVPGTYTFYLPVYKFIKITVVGAGGGQGGSGCTTAGCSGLASSCFGCPEPCCSGTCIFQSNGACITGFIWFCTPQTTTQVFGNTGSTGGTTRVSIGASTIVQATGGTGGSGGSQSTSGTAGSNGAGSVGTGYSGSTGTVNNGGSGITNGGVGGGGGSATTTVQHYVGTYFLWADTTAVTTLTIVVGAGGAGGTGNSICATQVSGDTGDNGSVTIEWV